MAPNPTTSFSALFGRLYWMMIGPMILTLLAVTIINIGSGWFTLADFAFLALVGGLILGRWLEFRGGAPLTYTGEPASPAHLQRFVLWTIIVGLTAWVIANLIGNHWLTR